jgi:hypothetical protein
MYFFSLIVFSTYFTSSYKFPEFLKENGKRENSNIVLGRLLGLRPGTVHPAQRQRWPTVPSPRHGGMLTDGATASHRSSSLRRKHGCEVGVMLCNRRGSGLTRTAWHRRGRKMGPMATASTSVAISGEQRQRLKAPAAPGSPARGEGQDQ